MSIPEKIDRRNYMQKKMTPRDVSILWFETSLSVDDRNKVKELCERISKGSQGIELDFVDGVRRPELITVQVDR